LVAKDQVAGNMALTGRRFYSFLKSKRVCEETPRPIRELRADTPPALAATVQPGTAQAEGPRWTPQQAQAALKDANGTKLVLLGTGGGPHIKVFNTTTLAELQSFFAFDPAFLGGVFVG
jgi:hypothetical protein